MTNILIVFLIVYFFLYNVKKGPQKKLRARGDISKPKYIQFTLRWDKQWQQIITWKQSAPGIVWLFKNHKSGQFASDRTWEELKEKEEMVKSVSNKY